VARKAWSSLLILLRYADERPRNCTVKMVSYFRFFVDSVEIVY